MKDRSIIGQKGLGQCKQVKKKKGENASVKVNNHGYLVGCTRADIDLFHSCGPVKLLLPHPGAECVKMHQHFVCVFQHTSYVGICPNMQCRHSVPSLLSLPPSHFQQNMPLDYIYMFSSDAAMQVHKQVSLSIGQSQ